MKNIVLIGISGSGKTYLGKRLSEKLSREFIDLDILISRAAGFSIEEIFKQEGEEGFRRRETQTIRDISGLNSKIIASGGGAVLAEENMDILSHKGIIIFLDRPVEDILESVEMSDRPLLRDNPERLKDIYNERLSLYNKYSDFIIKGGSSDQVLRKLIHISTLGGAKKNLAVIGDPIDHSLSPPIHLGALGPLLKKLEYKKIKVETNMLPQWVKTDGRAKLDGFNVTMPHKESIIPLLDAVDSEAEKIGAVNTVVNKGGKLKGYSTDGEGFSSALKIRGAYLSQSIVTIIGTGGAAKTIAMKAAVKGAREIHIIGRNLNKALEIVGAVNKSYNTSCHIHSFPLESVRKGLKDADFVINATPLGMKSNPGSFGNFSFLRQLKKNTFVCDIVYSDEKTQLIVEAEALGLKTMGGLDMLIEQALLADSLFLGAEIGREKARKRAEEHLEGGLVI